MVAAAAHGGIEAVIQTGPYSGLAPALNALAALSEALQE
jgi:hypothetical protein